MSEGRPFGDTSLAGAAAGNPAPQGVAVSPLNPPSGGGAIRGMGEALGDIGAGGMADLTLPLPVSGGRGYAPGLNLHYSSGAGNGVFGIGWSVPLMVISRRTSHGVPQYTDEDEFLGPGGEVLVPERNESGGVVARQRDRYGDKALGKSYSVVRYFPRVEGAFDLIEHWRGAAGDNFWLVHGADGQLHCLGKTALGRTASPEGGNLRIAEWSLEETVSPTGEHICYQYRAEDDIGVDTSGSESTRSRGALSHLVRVRYGNTETVRHLYAWDADGADAADWLFTLVFDYGERSRDPRDAPPFEVPPGDAWLARRDAFSGYRYGFEKRCHRLCRQVLMYHHFPKELGEDATLVGRLLLSYDENPVLSRLLSVRQWGGPAGGEVKDGIDSMPPLTFTYSAFDPAPSAAGWQHWEGLPGLNDDRPFQLVDLYGEGLPGVLSRLDDAWHYREPLRDGGKSGGDADAVCYGDWRAVPQIPAMQADDVRLMDSTGDGTLDWVVTRPGLAGYFSLGSDKTWSGFMPFSALPGEFLHPQAQLADLVGAGLSDLALIGPNSVRLYANQRGGFGAGRDITQDPQISLPVVGRDADALVAFSDLLGSGQQHLVEIDHDNVRCWPNLGRGRFGRAVHLGSLGLPPEDFNPQRLRLADIDGSGADDILYAHGDHLIIYFNRSGNGFAAPVKLPWPDSLRFDHLCQLNVADMGGNGVSGLLLTIPYPEVRHWRYDFCAGKPYLLDGFNNNMGADHRIRYRSSAQFWLDEKAADATDSTSLMFPVHVVARVLSTDEVTGNTLSQTYRYRKGVYDGREREFRGFGLIEEQDTSGDSVASGKDAAFSPPMLIKTWFHSGRQQDESALAGRPWSGDAAAVALSATRLTRWQADADADLPDGADEERWWMFRALKSHVLRRETYGLDNSPLQDTPYSVDCFRYQVRLHRPGHAQSGSAPVVLPVELEQFTGYYERIANDPRCTQQVTLRRDGFGYPLHAVDIDYPRRAPSPGASPYPDTLPSTAVASSYDAQQTPLRLGERRQSYYHLTDPAAWQLGSLGQQRRNELAEDQPTPGQAWSFESLSGADSPLERLTRIFAGQQLVYYGGNEGAPGATLPVLVDRMETAELDEPALRAYQDVPGMTPEQIKAALVNAGYFNVDAVLGEPNGSKNIWAIYHDSVQYEDDTFYLPGSHQKTSLSGVTNYNYNAYGFLESIVDALNNTTRVTTFDYRFMTPTGMLDINRNSSEAALDGLGRVVASSLYGTENNAAVGFMPIDPANAAPLSMDELIALGLSSAELDVATRCASDAFSWMGSLARRDMPDNAPWDALIANGWLLDSLDSETAYITAPGHRWAASSQGLADCRPETIQAIKTLINAAPRIPVHAAVLQADRYPGDAEQQKRISVRYNDGFGRALQVVVRAEPGPAYQREESGELTADGNGRLIEKEASRRWTVSGRVEYDNKGRTVRVYQPYFVNDWRYVADSAMRAGGYADTHFYDALGREVRVETAKGYLRRAARYPWFTVAEDENDTLLPE